MILVILEAIYNINNCCVIVIGSNARQHQKKLSTIDSLGNGIDL